MKLELPLHTPEYSEKDVPEVLEKRKRPTRFVHGIVFVICSISVFLYTRGFISNSIGNIKAGPQNPDSLCPLVNKLDPSEFPYNKDTINLILHDDQFRNKSVEKLLGAVQIPTQIHDDVVNPGAADSLEDLYKLEPSWKNFENFHTYLKKTFPAVHKHLKVEKINKFALVFTWQGSSEDKKPILLTAHQDVVPIQQESLDQWTYPPFEGGYDGEYLYGRGVSDCKNLLIGLLETIELLLNEDEFKPERTVVLGFGYDEESAGTGAENIFNHLVERYGPDSFLQIIDEGNGGFENIEGINFILPATGEKGHLDSVIEIFTPGGHSSVPNDHTSIGILAKLINKIEDVQYQSILTNANPVLNQLQCLAEHSTTIDKTLKKNILKAHFDQNANKEIVKHLDKDLSNRYLIRTSQAVDIVNGGVKANALPEHASVLVNQRIAIEESVESTTTKILNQIREVAEKFDLGIFFNGEEIVKPTENGYFNYSLSQPLEPAPVTPINDESWNLFGGALRHLYEDLVFPEKDDVFVVAPFISTGNTDTRFYWDLSRYIYRYEPGIPSKKPSNIHTVDESLFFDGHLSVIAFYYFYLQTIDKVKDEVLS